MNKQELIIKKFKNLASLLENQDSKKEKKKIFVLVGPPAVGKSTWIEQYFEEKPYIVSRDDIVENIVSSLGWKYEDMFVNPPRNLEIGSENEKYGEIIKAPASMPWAQTAYSKVVEANKKVNELLNRRMNNAAASGKDIIIDMTNMTPAARRKALGVGSSKHYEKIAVVFEFSGIEELLQKVADKRNKLALKSGVGKPIPQGAFNQMFKSFQYPTKQEGFDRIISIDNRDLIKKLATEPVKENKLSLKKIFCS